MKILEHFISEYLNENKFIGEDFVFSNWWNIDITEAAKTKIKQDLVALKAHLNTMYSYEPTYLSIEHLVARKENGEFTVTDNKPVPLPTNNITNGVLYSVTSNGNYVLGRSSGTWNTGAAITADSMGYLNNTHTIDIVYNFEKIIDADFTKRQFYSGISKDTLHYKILLPNLEVLR